MPIEQDGSGAWQPSDWSGDVEGFCESLAPYGNEWGNFASSFVIVLFGVYGLYQLPPTIHQVSDVWQWVYSAMIAAGIGSALFHLLLTIGWLLFDQTPMLLAQYYGLCQLTELNMQIMFRNHSIQYYTFSILSKFLNLLWIFALVWALIVSALYGGPRDGYFGVMFAVPLLLIPANGFWTVSLLKRKGALIESDEEEIKALSRFVHISTIVAVLAGVIWIFTETLCEKYPVLSLFQLHAVWHVAMSYSMFNIIQCGVYADFKLGFLEVGIRTPRDARNCCQRVCYYTMAILHYDISDAGRAPALSTSPLSSV